MGANTLSVALVAHNVLNGFAGHSPADCRTGSDLKGLALAFTLGAISYWLLAAAGYTPLGFVMCAGLIFFAGARFFPVPLYLHRYRLDRNMQLPNARFLYTAKGTSIFLVPLANVMKSATGSWEAISSSGRPPT